MNYNGRVILSIVVCFLFMGTLITVKNAKAEEIDVDYEFIDNLVAQLANENQTYWQGREYGTPGEQDAAQNLKNAWDQNMPGYAPALKDSIYIGPLNKIDDKLVLNDAWSYNLFINNQEVPRTSHSYQPIPCLFHKYQNIDNQEYVLKKAPDAWYQEICGRTSQEDVQAPCYQINYFSLGGSIVDGELTYVKDYSSFHPDGETGIHLIEIDNAVSDDIFNEKMNQIINANGSGFVVITDNPTFINKKITTLPGVAINRKDGERLKETINSYDEVYIEAGKELTVYPYMDDHVNTIYLIELSKIKYYDSQNPIGHYHDDGRGWNATSKFFFYSLKLHNTPMDAFLFQDLSGKTTFNFGINDMVKNPTKSYALMIPSHMRPGFMISGVLGDPLENETLIRFSIFSHKDYHISSYDVTGTIQGENPECIVICGHYDTFWGKGTIDNSVGPSLAWGIGKWFYDNYYSQNKMPKYTIKCVAFAGEEYIDMGSQFWVYKYIEQEHLNVVSVINTDTVSMTVPGIPFTPWIYTKDPNRFDQILTTMDLKGYYDKTGTHYQSPELWKWRKNICDQTDTYEFRDYANDIIAIDRWPYQNSSNQWPGDLLVQWGDHRGGPTNNDGDTLDKIDYTDLHAIADMIKDLAIYCAVESNLDFVSTPSFTLIDLDLDNIFDSVKIDFGVQTDVSCWGSAELCIYQSGTALTKTLVQKLDDIQQGGENNYEMTITLPPNATAGTYEVELTLKDYNGNSDAQSSQYLALSPFKNPMADFTEQCDRENSKLFSFEDTSLASPNALITSWNWSLGDGSYSNQQECQYTYTETGTYNITLTVIDNTLKSANITKTIEVYNTLPVASFNAETTITTPNTMIQFNSEAYDIDGSITNTTWYFSDDSIEYGNTVMHSFSKSGFYSIYQIVKDNDNSTNDTFVSNYILVADALIDDNFQDDSNAHKWNTIKKGLDNVTDGAVIYVYNGQYASFEVDKSVALYGENQVDVNISGGNPGIKIRSNNVTIDGFNIGPGTEGVNVFADYTHIKNCIFHNNTNMGIILNHSDNCTLENCVIVGDGYGVKLMNNSMWNVIKNCSISQDIYGIFITNSSYNFIGSPSITTPEVTDSSFSHCNKPIYLQNASFDYIIGCDIAGGPSSGSVSKSMNGICLNSSVNNTISSCKIHNVSGNGICLKSSSGNKIDFCKITWNTNGISLENSPENLLAQNHFGGNSQYAVHIPGETPENQIYYNDFFNNGYGLTNQIWDANGARGVENLWSKAGNNTLTKTGNGEGNYWSNYQGIDMNHDGIGDTPYLFNSGGIERNDSFPVMEPYGWWGCFQNNTPPEINYVTATPHTTGLGCSESITSTVTDDDNISLVTVNITYPDQSVHIFTMNLTGNSVYEYILADTWLTGQYNYHVWAIDENYNTNTSSAYHFHVSAIATIQVGTTKNAYVNNEYISLTAALGSDPATVFKSSSPDGYIKNVNTNYLTAQGSTTGTVDDRSSSMPIGQTKSVFPPFTYEIDRGFLFFDTSTIPGNLIIDSAKLGLYKVNDNSITDFMITVQNGQPTYPRNPMQPGDYNKNYYTGNGGAFDTSGFANGYNYLNLNINGVNWIVHGGMTKLCLRSSRDIIPTAPDRTEYVTITTHEYPLDCGPTLTMIYRNQSKIKNTGISDIKGYLLIQVQQFDSRSGTWKTVDDTIDEQTPRTITHGNQLALDSIFNGRVNTHFLPGSGLYRVYAAFQDPLGNILVDSNGNHLVSTYQFTVTL